MPQAIELPLSKNNLSISRINMSIKEKKLGGRPKLASYQKRTKCFRVMFTENDYIYIQSKAEQAGLSVNEFCHQAAKLLKYKNLLFRRRLQQSYC